MSIASTASKAASVKITEIDVPYEQASKDAADYAKITAQPRMGCGALDDRAILNWESNPPHHCIIAATLLMYANELKAQPYKVSQEMYHRIKIFLDRFNQAKEIDGRMFIHIETAIAEIGILDALMMKLWAGHFRSEEGLPLVDRAAFEQDVAANFFERMHPVG